MKIEIRSINGNILFEYECENNSIKKSLVEAARSGVNLSGANLYGADLYGANLRGSNLIGANLYEADLNGIDID